MPEELSILPVVTEDDKLTALLHEYYAALAWNERNSRSGARIAVAETAIREFVAHLVRENERLKKMLSTATVRLGILRGRMEACDDASGHRTHELSLCEVPDWIQEQQEVRQ